jgi:hypothetical protein
MMKRLTLQTGVVRVTKLPMIQMEAISLQVPAIILTARTKVVITANTKMDLGITLHIPIMMVSGNQLPVEEIHQQKKNVKSALQTIILREIGRKLAILS